MTRRGLLIILSSPSGAGKSTLARRLRDLGPGDPLLRLSHDTRKPRPGEVDGQGLSFHRRGLASSAWSTNGQMLEHAHVFGHFYGSPLGPVKDAIDDGCDVLFDIDWQGAQQIQKSSLSPPVCFRSFFFRHPSAELRNRLENRGQDSAEVIEKRMNRSWDEISHWDGYNYVLINDDLDATEERLKTIVTAERLRASQQPGLVDHVRNLQSEFEERARDALYDLRRRCAAFCPRAGTSGSPPDTHIIGQVVLV